MHHDVGAGDGGRARALAVTGRNQPRWNRVSVRLRTARHWWPLNRCRRWWKTPASCGGDGEMEGLQSVGGVPRVKGAVALSHPSHPFSAHRFYHQQLLNSQSTDLSTVGQHPPAGRDHYRVLL